MKTNFIFRLSGTMLLYLMIGIYTPMVLHGQAPQRMSYQAVIRDASNELIKEKVISMRVSILQGSTEGNTLYAEIHTASTNLNGLVSLEIGGGTVVSGTISGVDWSEGPYYLKTETDPGGGNNYSITGVSQLLSVPYALYATTSGSSTPGPQGPPGLITPGSAAGNTAYWNGSEWVVNNSNIFNDGVQVGIGTSNPEATAKLEIKSETQGFLPPRMTSVQRDAIINPALGLVIYNTGTNCLNVYIGNGWNEICGTGVTDIGNIIEEQNKRLGKAVTKEEVEIFLRVIVSDEEGTPMPDVEIKSGSVTTVTDKDGVGFFESVKVNRDFAVVQATREGYMKGSRTINPRPGSLNTATIRLMREGEAKTFMSDEGGSLRFEENKVGVTFTGGTIVDESGNAYTGEVKVYARYLDPRDNRFSTIMPGMLVGLSEVDSLERMISYGMISVEMRDGDNKTLQLGPGKKARVELPAVLDEPVGIPVWHYNERYGLWVESGISSKEGSKYSFEVNHFSTWNLDTKEPDPIDEVEIEIVDKEGIPLGNQRIELYDETLEKRLAYVTTDESGKLRLLRTPRRLQFRFIFPCDSIDILVELVAPKTQVMAPCPEQGLVFNIEGSMKDCDNALYQNSFYIMQVIERDDIQYIGKTDENGRYSAANIVCSIDSTVTYNMECIISAGTGLFKRDTIMIRFDREVIMADINFCGIMEEEDVYPPGTVHCNGIPTEVVEVTNPITGRTWMDRNLGASRGATSSIDTLAYGDLYQWGRRGDGHQCRNSGTTTTLSNSDQPPHGTFILAPELDWRSPQNTNLWQGVNGVNNPCPIGYRLPTDIELDAERTSWSSNDATGAFASPLKLPVAGRRSSSNGSLFDVGSFGLYWSSTVGNTSSSYLYFNSSNAVMGTGSRAHGFSVRCLKD